jgi:propionate CoA-transferase
MSGLGRHPKFVDEVDHLTFNGQEALTNGQEVFLATENFTLQLTAEGWVVHSFEDSDEVRSRLAALPILNQGVKR